MSSALSRFLQHYYPGLPLRARLFYLWPIGIRFDLQHQTLSTSDEAYFQEVERRATLLFEAVFLPTDSILVVYQQRRDKRLRVRHSNYLRQKLLLPKKQLFFQRIANPYPRDFQPGQWQRVTAITTLAQLPYAAILRAIGNQDFSSRKPHLHEETYFLNQRTGLIFYMYDDRGLDILGPDVTSLRQLYAFYNDLILDYDRERIDATFAR